MEEGEFAEVLPKLYKNYINLLFSPKHYTIVKTYATQMFVFNSCVPLRLVRIWPHLKGITRKLLLIVLIRRTMMNTKNGFVSFISLCYCYEKPIFTYLHGVCIRI